MRLPVIIPVLDRPNLLAQTLKSAFNHAVKKIIPIVIDDMSGPEVRKVCQPFIDKDRIRYHRMHRQSGPGVCRTYGAAISPTDHPHIYFSDSDVYFQPGWDEIFFKTIEEFQDFGIVAGTRYTHRPVIQTISKNGISIEQTQECGGVSMYLRRRDWQKLGPFKATKLNIPSEDIDLCKVFTEDGLKIGSVTPHTIIHTGLTSSFWTQSERTQDMLQQKIAFPKVLFE